MAIATLHHLPLDAVLGQLRAALAPGGVLVVLDLYRAAGWSDCVTSVPAMPVSLVLRLVHTGRLRPPPAVRQAWDDHGRHDNLLTLEEVRQAARPLLPGCRVRRHLLWRYSLVWRKG